jgi:hypothetical protein
MRDRISEFDDEIEAYRTALCEQRVIVVAAFYSLHVAPAHRVTEGRSRAGFRRRRTDAHLRARRSSMVMRTPPARRDVVQPRIAKIQPAAGVGGLDSRFYVDSCGVEDYAAALTVM